MSDDKPDGSKRSSVLKRWNFNTLCALGFIAFGVLLVLIIPYQVEKQMTLFGAPASDLPPSLFPNIVATIFILLGVWFLFESFSLKETNELKELESGAWINVAVTLGVLLAYAIAMEPVGFVPSSVVMVGVLAAYYGVRNILLLLSVSIGVPVLVYIVFREELQTFLPESFLYDQVGF